MFGLYRIHFPNQANSTGEWYNSRLQFKTKKEAQAYLEKAKRNNWLPSPSFTVRLIAA